MTEAKPYKVAGSRLECLICGYDLFQHRQAQLNTVAIFDLDWANASAMCLVCDQCGYIHWFLP